MDAFTVAAQMLGGLELDAGQLAQLRAIDSKYQQRLYALLHASDTPARLGGWYSEPDTPGVAHEPTPAELAELRAMLETDIRSLLSPEQRGRLDRSGGWIPAEDNVLAWESEGGRLD
ncbi:MAG TPA: hypothetical protein VF746_28415 [Longimicrobium sp.]|jgi:hypothetical protein